MLRDVGSVVVSGPAVSDPPLWEIVTLPSWFKTELYIMFLLVTRCLVTGRNMMYISVLNHEGSVMNSHTKGRVRHGGFAHKHGTHMLNNSNVLNMKKLLIFYKRKHYLLLYNTPEVPTS